LLIARSFLSASFIPRVHLFNTWIKACSIDAGGATPLQPLGILL